MTDDEATAARRRGYWLRLARERADLTLAAAAEAAGLRSGSGSTVSLWEGGQRAIKVTHLIRLARRYRVPVSVFMTPEMTDEERLDEAIRSASAAERVDWDAEAEDSPRAEDELGDELRTRSA